MGIMQKIFGYLLLCLLFLCTSCDSLKYNFKNQKIEMNLKIHTIKEIETYTYKIKGKLQVKNLTENICLFDLRNIELKSDGNIEYKIYIDSIATRLIEVQEIKPHEMYIENVYCIVYSDKKLLIKELDYSD